MIRRVLFWLLILWGVYMTMHARYKPPYVVHMENVQNETEALKQLRKKSSFPESKAIDLSDHTIAEILALSGNHDDFFLPYLRKTPASLKHGAQDLYRILAKPNNEYTVFAPTDTAFLNLPKHVKNKLRHPENFLTLMHYHIVPGHYDFKERKVHHLDPSFQAMSIFHRNVLESGPYPTLAPDESVKVKLTDPIMVDGHAKVVAQIKANNGVIYVVDDVLIP